MLNIRIKLKPLCQMFEKLSCGLARYISICFLSISLVLVCEMPNFASEQAASNNSSSFWDNHHVQFFIGLAICILVAWILGNALMWLSLLSTVIGVITYDRMLDGEDAGFLIMLGIFGFILDGILRGLNVSRARNSGFNPIGYLLFNAIRFVFSIFSATIPSKEDLEKQPTYYPDSRARFDKYGLRADEEGEYNEYGEHVGKRSKF